MVDGIRPNIITGLSVADDQSLASKFSIYVNGPNSSEYVSQGVAVISAMIGSIRQAKITHSYAL